MKHTIVKSNGEKVEFSSAKLRRSLKKSGADNKTVSAIIKQITGELFPGITTKEIYNRAFALLKRHGESFAPKYSLKNAIYQFGPSGFPFEKFVGELFKREGYKVKIGEVLPGKCVSHEVDVVAIKNNIRHLVECKFHSEEGRNCDVKVPLYIHSRFKDINEKNRGTDEEIKGWVVTNTRFTDDALKYGRCMGLYLLSWNYPEKDSLKNRIDTFKLYPVTISTLLTQEEKHFLLDRDIILASQLMEQEHWLEHLGISEERKKRILKEFRSICKTDGHEKA